MSNVRVEGFEAWVFDAFADSIGERFQDARASQAFNDYLNEGIFFWQFLRPMLEERAPAQVLEVGSGVGLLSMLASDLAASVTSLEPESAGFARMSTFREVLAEARTRRAMPTFQDCFLSELPSDKTYDFIFAINVLEHVPDPEALVAEIYDRLNPGGLAWLVFPNYDFPYEQHFEIPILLNKKLTEVVFRERIFNNAVGPASREMWEDLSWPTFKNVKNFLHERGWAFQFQKIALRGYLDRLGDPAFVNRKGPVYRALSLISPVLRPVVAGLPLRISPVVEVKITKPIRKVTP